MPGTLLVKETDFQKTNSIIREIVGSIYQKCSLYFDKYSRKHGIVSTKIGLSEWLRLHQSKFPLFKISLVNRATFKRNRMTIIDQSRSFLLCDQLSML